MEYEMSKTRSIAKFARNRLVLPAYVVAVLLATAGAGAILGGGTARADDALPSGSYQSTCDSMRMVDGVLLAACRSANQAMRLTSLPSPFACPGGVANNDGRLECDKARAPAPAPLPVGSYTKSCNDIKVVDNVLFATCRQGNQVTRSLSLPRPFACSGSIDNEDGRLKCRAPVASPPGPVLWGAIAVADGRNDAAGTVDSSGTGSGATRRDAEAAALTSCGAASCAIKASFQGGCGAYASSHRHAGSGIGPNLSVATQQALIQCNKNKCRVAVQYCPGQ